MKIIKSTTLSSRDVRNAIALWMSSSYHKHLFQLELWTTDRVEIVQTLGDAVNETDEDCIRITREVTP